MLPVLSNPRRRAQGGAALLVSMLLVLLIGISSFLAFSQGVSADAAKQRRTDAALAEAKAALIGYAIGRPLDIAEADRRLGELPCPDNDGDGDADIACANESDRIGRLPWKTLGLPDLRDGDGERLWYAISNIYKTNPRTTCAHPEEAGCLNSDATGSITLRDANGNITHDATPSDPPTYRGAIAVVIAPGAILTRQDGTVQLRSSAPAPGQAAHYLDNAHGEDNANFGDYTSNGFIAGPVRDAASGNIVANDRIVAVTYEDLMPALERRVAQEVGNCLDVYASVNQNRYPWAADLRESAENYNYADSTGKLTGRIPQTLSNTRSSSLDAMSDTWQVHPSCFLRSGMRWWDEWKLRVFYSVADWHKPGSVPPMMSCDACMYAFTPTATLGNVRYFVAVAGKRLQGVSGNQPRATTANLYDPANFLEQENAVMFATPGQSNVRIGPLGTAFNDVAVVKLN